MAKGQKKDGSARKSTKGIPRVTDKVLAMNETERAEWLGKVPAEHRAEIEKRLNEALKEGRKPKKIDWASTFKGRTAADLTEAQVALTAEMGVASVTAIAEQEKIVAKATATLAALRAAKSATADSAPSAS